MTQTCGAFAHPMEAIAIARGEFIERGGGGGERKRIAIQCSGMHHFAFRDPVHIFGLTGEHAERSTRAYGFGEHGEVGRNAVAALGSPQIQAEARDDLVKHQQRARFGSRRAKELKKARVRRHGTAVAQQRFAEDGGEVAPVLGKGALHAGAVVPFHHHHVIVRQLTGSHGHRHAAAALFQGRVVTHQRLIAPAVIVAFELKELASPGDGAR